MSASSEIGIRTEERLGEVIETSTLGYWAESDRLHELPPLGSIVQAKSDSDLTVFGIVAFGQTSSIDPGRRAVRRGTPDVADEAIYHRHPELDHVLRTTFYVSAAGYAQSGRIRPSLPPSPVPLHYSVRQANVETVRAFCARPAYLSLMIDRPGEVPPDQVIAAHLRWVDDQLDDDHAWLRSAARFLARTLRRDYARLVTILEAVDPELA